MMTKSCQRIRRVGPELSCMADKNQQVAILLHPWSWPSGAWQRIHIDFAGPSLHGARAFLVIDTYTLAKWFEIFLPTIINHSLQQTVFQNGQCTFNGTVSSMEFVIT